MAAVGVLIIGGAILLLRVVTSSSSSEPAPIGSPSATPAFGCADDQWFDSEAESCVAKATCEAGQVYDDRTNTCALPAPTVTEVSPGSGPPKGGTELTVLGIGFQLGATLTVNGIPATDVTVVDSSTITARTPESAVFYPVDVTVTNPDSQSDVLDNVFTYEEPQVERISEIVPDTGSAEGGEAVIVKGRDFVAGAVMSFNGRPATQVEVLNPTTIRVVIPAGPIGPVPVNVRNPGEDAITVRGAFAYVDRAPRVVESVRPSKGPSGGGTRITIIGSGFAPGATVDIGGSPARQVDVVSTTRITARTPAGDLGTADVAVRNPDVPAAILPDGFTYLEAPTITEVSPRRGPQEGGTRVTITGTGFTEDAVVTVGDVTVDDAVVVDEATIRLVTPPAADPIAVAITVTNPGQPTATLRKAFTYQETPAVEEEEDGQSSRPTPKPTTRPTARPSPTAAALPACTAYRLPDDSGPTGGLLTLTAADLFPASRGITNPVLVAAEFVGDSGDGSDGSITWQARPPQIAWSVGSTPGAGGTIVFSYTASSCSGVGSGVNAYVSAR